MNAAKAIAMNHGAALAVLGNSVTSLLALRPLFD